MFEGARQVGLSWVLPFPGHGLDKLNNKAQQNTNTQSQSWFPKRFTEIFMHIAGFSPLCEGTPLASLVERRDAGSLSTMVNRMVKAVETWMRGKELESNLKYDLPLPHYRALAVLERG